MENGRSGFPAAENREAEGMNERETLKVNESGHLEIGGADCVDLAKQFGTPL